MAWKGALHGMAKKEITLVANDAELVGDITFTSQFVVNGVLRGSTSADATGAAMTISPNGRVIGDIRVPKIVIHGKVEGTVYSSEHLEIAEGAVIQGDLHYRVLQMHMGASVQGRLVHTEPEKSAADTDSVVEKEKPTTVGIVRGQT